MESNQDYSYLDLPTQSKESVVTPIIENIRAKNPIDSTSASVKTNEPFSVNFGSINNQGIDKRIQTFDNTTPFLDVYKPLSGGDTVAMYPTYVPRIDNNELLASQQSMGEKLANGVTKHLGYGVGTAVIGGTVGFVYGLEQALVNWDIGKFSDNSLSNWLNDVNVKVGYQLPNYYKKQEEQLGVFGQMGTTNFWADKLLGGLSFTAGAIISEGIWGWATGGTSLATTGARLGGKIAGLGRVGRWSTEALGEANLIAAMAKNKSLFKNLAFETGEQIGKDALRARQFAVGFGRAGEAASIIARTARSAGYEASVESLQYKKEAEENFYRNFADLNGREPNSEEIAQFEKENEETANLVLGANLAIIMPSNLIGLGHVLNIKNPVNLGITDFINKKAFGYGINAATKEVTKGTTKQIFARNAFDYVLKPGVTEGLFEEGLQGVTNKTANNWIEHTYNPKYTNENFDQVESFSKSMAEQYGSEEGWKENILGILIGIAGGSLNVRGAQKAKSNELEFEASMNRTYDQKTLQSMLLPSRIQMANRVAGFSEDALSEEKKGNLINSHNARIGAITTMVNGKLITGESISDMTKEMQSSLDALTPEQWAESGVEADQIDTVKAEQLAEFKNVAQSWKTNKEYVQYMVGSKIVGEQDLEDTKLEGIFGTFSKNAQIVEALAYQLTIGENSLKGMQDIQGIFGRELGSENARVPQVIAKLSAAEESVNRKLVGLRKIYNVSKTEREKILARINRLNQAPKENQATESHKKEILTATEAFKKAEQKVLDVEMQAQQIADELSNTTMYSSRLQDISLNTDIVTIKDLLELEENVKKFESIIEQQKQLNPQKAKYLEDLREEYNQANEVFLQSLATQKALVSTDKFEIKNIDGWLSNFFKKNGKMSQPTQEWFQEAINSYNDFQKNQIAPLLSDKAEEENVLKTELEEGEVSQESLQAIAAKKDKDLDKTEREVYESNKEAIDAIRVENNTKTKPKSQEQINQEKIEALEAERTQKLAEVQPIVLTNEVEIERLRAEEQAELKELFPNAELNSEGKIDSEKLSEEELTLYNKVYDRYDKLITPLLQEVQTEVTNQAEIDKINREYDAKIEALQPTPQDKIAEYKKRIENMLKGIYVDLIPTEETVDGVASKRPTQAEIEEYRELKKANKENTKRGKELAKILKNWKLMATLTDDGYISIVDLLDNIAQQETEIAQETTKDEVTETDAKDIVEEAMSKEPEFKGSRSADNKKVMNNSSAPVVAKINEDGTKIEFAHLKAFKVVEQIGKPFTIKRKDKDNVYQYIDNSTVTDDKVEIGDIIEIDNMSFEMVENYRLSFDYSQVKSRAQQLNLYVEESQTYLNWTSVYSIFGNEKIKTPSQFGDNNISREASFKVKKGDTVTLHVEDIDNWNKSKKGSTEDEFKIFAKDKDGNNVGELKSGKPKFGDPINPQYADIRRKAFENWEEAGRPDEMNLGVSIEVGEVLLTAPELRYSDGRLVDGKIEQEEVEKVIIGKGYSENGVITVDKVKEFDESKISTVYLGRLTKKNPNMKIPLVVFKVGENIIAFPISMVKQSSPIEFDTLLQGTSQEMVKAVNQAIIDNNIATPKLSFSDIALDYRGEVVLSNVAEKAKKAFTERTTFTTAEQLASKDYDANSLAKDATIRINLANLDEVFSTPKIVLNLDNVEVKQTRARKYETMSEIEEGLNEIVVELDRDWRVNSATKYTNSKGEILEDIPYTNAFDNNQMDEGNGNLSILHNIRILREALTDSKGNLNVTGLPQIVKNAVGLDTLKLAKTLLDKYDAVKNQPITKPVEVQNGLDNIC